MWSCIDKIRVGDESGGEADGGAVEGRDEDFGMRVEGVGYVEVVGDEGAEDLFAVGFRAGGRRWGY